LWHRLRRAQQHAARRMLRNHDATVSLLSSTLASEMLGELGCLRGMRFMTFVQRSRDVMMAPDVCPRGPWRKLCDRERHESGSPCVRAHLQKNPSSESSLHPSRILHPSRPDHPCPRLGLGVAGRDACIRPCYTSTHAALSESRSTIQGCRLGLGMEVPARWIQMELVAPSEKSVPKIHLTARQKSRVQHSEVSEAAIPNLHARKRIPRT
jgi:hypothetical protein